MNTVRLASWPLLGSPATPEQPDELTELRDITPRGVYRWAIAMGWSPAAAGQLAAFYAGIRMVDDDEHEAVGWSWQGVSRLIWLRGLVLSGRLGGDTEA